MSNAIGAVALLLGLTCIPCTIPIALIVTVLRRWRNAAAARAFDEAAAKAQAARYGVDEDRL